VNNVAMARAVQNAVRRRFHGNRTLIAKEPARFPEFASEEYARIARAYMRMLGRVLRAYLPAIRRAITAEREAERFDGAMRRDASVMRMIRQALENALMAFEKMATSFGLERRIERIAAMARRHSVREWKRIVRKTLGINILEDHYSGEFYGHEIKRWVAKNVGLIKSLPGQSLTRMQNIIEAGYLEGKSHTEIGRLIQEAYGIDRRRADFIARDQLGKLDGDLTEAQQRAAGVEEYEWSSSGDARVRECHAYLDGKTFRWDSPPEMWYMTKSRGRVYTGRKCHPKQDFQCRCVALTVFKIDTLNLPWEGGS